MARRGRTPFELRLTDDEEDPQTWEVKSTSLAPLSQLLALFFNKRRVVPPSLRRYNRVVIDGYGVLATEDELKMPLKTFTQEAAQGIVRVEVTLEQAELEAQRRGYALCQLPEIRRRLNAPQHEPSSHSARLHP